MSSRVAWRALPAGLGALSLLALAPSLAHAHKNGIGVGECAGCHAGGRQATVELEPDVATIALGQTVRLSVTIAADGAAVGGLFFRVSNGAGSLALVSGETTRLLNGGITHSAPKPSSNQTIRFVVDWKAPLVPGDVEFLVAGVAANGDGRSSNDATGSAYLTTVFGCPGAWYYPDYDRDGFGAEEGARMACSAPMSFVSTQGDCDNYDVQRFPGASEVCNNQRDDDCDDQVDEECGASQCGAVAPTKRDAGAGSRETCNGMDDDCDGKVDNGAGLCAIGEICSHGACRLPALDVDTVRDAGNGDVLARVPAGRTGPIDAAQLADDPHVDAGEPGSALSGGCSLSDPRAAFDGLAPAWLLLALLWRPRARRRA